MIKYFVIIIYTFLSLKCLADANNNLKLSVKQVGEDFLFDIKSINPQKLKLFFIKPCKISFILTKNNQSFVYKHMDIKQVKDGLLAGETAKQTHTYIVEANQLYRIDSIPKQNFIRQLTSKSNVDFINKNITMPSLKDLKNEGFDVTVKFTTEAVILHKSSNEVLSLKIKANSKKE